MMVVPGALAGDLVDNAVVADFDGDGAEDLAIGVPGRCGAIEVWLSSRDPRLGLPEDVTDERTALASSTLWIEPERCDPEFGRRVIVEHTREGTPLLATLPDALGVATAQIDLSSPLDPEIVVVGRTQGPASRARSVSHAVVLRLARGPDDQVVEAIPVQVSRDGNAGACLVAIALPRDHLSAPSSHSSLPSTMPSPQVAVGVVGGVVGSVPVSTDSVVGGSICGSGIGSVASGGVHPTSVHIIHTTGTSKR
jgi:hypothetical protein